MWYVDRGCGRAIGSSGNADELFEAMCLGIPGPVTKSSLQVKHRCPQSPVSPARRPPLPLPPSPGSLPLEPINIVAPTPLDRFDRTAPPCTTSTMNPTFSAEGLSRILLRYANTVLQRTTRCSTEHDRQMSHPRLRLVSAITRL